MAIATFVSISAQAESKSVIAYVPDAEFVFVTSDNRLFAAASDGLYYIPRNGYPPSRVPIALDSTSPASTAVSCYFGAMAQVGNYLYADCTTNPLTLPRNYLLAMDLTANAGMRAFYSAADGVFYNGLAADGKGDIYVSMFPVLSLTNGRIEKFTLSTPTSVASRSAWLATMGRPNGLQVYGNTLYFTENTLNLTGAPSYLRKATISTYGWPSTIQTIYQTDSGALLDDFILVSDGLVLTAADANSHLSSPANQILHINESGQVLNKNAIPFTLPSSVFIEKSPNAGALYVAERGGAPISGSGDVAEYFQSWNLSPRK
jgi:hypothetical protein